MNNFLLLFFKHRSWSETYLKNQCRCWWDRQLHGSFHAFKNWMRDNWHWYMKTSQKMPWAYNKACIDQRLHRVQFIEDFLMVKWRSMTWVAGDLFFNVTLTKVASHQAEMYLIIHWHNLTLRTSATFQHLWCQDFVGKVHNTVLMVFVCVFIKSQKWFRGQSRLP